MQARNRIISVATKILQSYKSWVEPLREQLALILGPFHCEVYRLSRSSYWITQLQADHNRVAWVVQTPAVVVRNIYAIVNILTFPHLKAIKSVMRVGH